MIQLSDLLTLAIEPEPATIHPPKITPVRSPLPIGGPAWLAYERAVFNELLAQRHALGIREVWKCQNVRLDGLLDLGNGAWVGLEIKFRMNWAKACQACAQVAWYHSHPEAETRPLAGAIVVFEEFSADWARVSPSRRVENGWNYWYTEHARVEGLPVHLVRLRAGVFETYPVALDAAR